MQQGTNEKTRATMRCGAAVLVLAALLAVCAAGCAPQANVAPTETADGQEEPIQVDFSWSEDADCGVCHTKEQASFEDQTCGAFLHADMTCTQCHADASALAGVHEGATAEKAAKAALKTTSVDASVCESCHAVEDVAAATADVTVLTDENGTVVNPHALTASEDHEQIVCTSCHQEHASGASIEKKAQRACASCHHANVYECYTCHS